jgi:hypothetical protein
MFHWLCEDENLQRKLPANRKQGAVLGLSGPPCHVINQPFSVNFLEALYCIFININKKWKTLQKDLLVRQSFEKDIVTRYWTFFFFQQRPVALGG